MSKILRGSVMRASEWFKERDQDEWQRTRQQVLQRDHYTCAYCQLSCRKFMQVNHIGAEDNHGPENLETICPPCHSVLHLGINVLENVISIFDCKPEVTNMAAIVCETRKLVAHKVSWENIEADIYQRFGRPEGQIYAKNESLRIVNEMLARVPINGFRGYLPDGLAILFHEEGPWNDFPEAIWKWQCLSSSHYRKQQA